MQGSTNNDSSQSIPQVAHQGSIRQSVTNLPTIADIAQGQRSGSLAGFTLKNISHVRHSAKIDNPRFSGRLSTKTMSQGQATLPEDDLNRSTNSAISQSSSADDAFGNEQGRIRATSQNSNIAKGNVVKKNKGNQRQPPKKPVSANKSGVKQQSQPPRSTNFDSKPGTSANPLGSEVKDREAKKTNPTKKDKLQRLPDVSADGKKEIAVSQKNIISGQNADYSQGYFSEQLPENNDRVDLKEGQKKRDFEKTLTNIPKEQERAPQVKGLTRTRKKRNKGANSPGTASPVSPNVNENSKDTINVPTLQHVRSKKKDAKKALYGPATDTKLLFVDGKFRLVVEDEDSDSDISQEEGERKESTKTTINKQKSNLPVIHGKPPSANPARKPNSASRGVTIIPQHEKAKQELLASNLSSRTGIKQKMTTGESLRKVSFSKMASIPRSLTNNDDSPTVAESLESEGKVPARPSDMTYNQFQSFKTNIKNTNNRKTLFQRLNPFTKAKTPDINSHQSRSAVDITEGFNYVKDDELVPPQRSSFDDSRNVRKGAEERRPPPMPPRETEALAQNRMPQHKRQPSKGNIGVEEEDQPPVPPPRDKRHTVTAASAVPVSSEFAPSLRNAIDGQERKPDNHKSVVKPVASGTSQDRKVSVPVVDQGRSGIKRSGSNNRRGAMRGTKKWSPEDVQTHATKDGDARQSFKMVDAIRSNSKAAALRDSVRKGPRSSKMTRPETVAAGAQMTEATVQGQTDIETASDGGIQKAHGTKSSVRGDNGNNSDPVRVRKNTDQSAASNKTERQSIVNSSKPIPQKVGQLGAFIDSLYDQAASLPANKQLATKAMEVSEKVLRISHENQFPEKLEERQLSGKSGNSEVSSPSSGKSGKKRGTKRSNLSKNDIRNKRKNFKAFKSREPEYKEPEAPLVTSTNKRISAFLTAFTAPSTTAAVEEEAGDITGVSENDDGTGELERAYDIEESNQVEYQPIALPKSVQAVTSSNNRLSAFLGRAPLPPPSPSVKLSHELADDNENRTIVTRPKSGSIEITTRPYPPNNRLSAFLTTGMIPVSAPSDSLMSEFETSEVPPTVPASKPISNVTKPHPNLSNDRLSMFLTTGIVPPRVPARDPIENSSSNKLTSFLGGNVSLLSEKSKNPNDDLVKASPKDAKIQIKLDMAAAAEQTLTEVDDSSPYGVLRKGLRNHKEDPTKVVSLIEPEEGDKEDPTNLYTSAKAGLRRSQNYSTPLKNFEEISRAERASSISKLTPASVPKLPPAKKNVISNKSSKLAAKESPKAVKVDDKKPKLFGRLRGSFSSFSSKSKKLRDDVEAADFPNASLNESEEFGQISKNKRSNSKNVSTKNPSNKSKVPANKLQAFLASSNVSSPDNEAASNKK